jgi:leucyl aminopeptidase
MLKPSYQFSLLSLSILSSFAIDAYAIPTNRHVVVAPQCLLNKLSAPMKTLATQASLTLIETNDQGIDALVEAKTIRSKTPCGGFMDVSDTWNEYTGKFSKESDKASHFLKQYVNTPETARKPANYSIRYETTVNQLLKNVQQENIWANLTAFSNTSKGNFPDRYANSDNGVKAAEWLKNKIDVLAKEHNRTDISTYMVATMNYKQPSVVVKIGTSNEPGIVIGGHMDTLSSSWGVKPGADDDGSGSMTVMEVARTLITSGVQFKKPIYIMWYAAEELGLYGSKAVVKEFKNKKIPVDSVLQMDMTGYPDKFYPNTIWLVTDYVNPALTDFLESLIKTYVKQPVGRTRCGYACSDHASWTNGGFKAAFPFEASFNNDNPDVHTSQDTIDHLSLSHMTDYAKLGVAFAVELAEPVV